MMGQISNYNIFSGEVLRAKLILYKQSFGYYLLLFDIIFIPKYIYIYIF